MRILVAGGGGYLGGNIIDHFSDRHEFINISLTNRAKWATNNVLVDLSKPLDYLEFDQPIDAIINCVECHPARFDNSEKMKKTYLDIMKNLISYAKSRNISRIVHFSINHINTVENDYQQAKFVAEGLVRNSGLKYVIFKPSIIFGENSPFDYLLDALVKRSFLFRFWNTEAKFAPVHLLDVFSNIDFLFKSQDSWNDTYTLLGPEVVGFEELMSRRSQKQPFLVDAPNAFISRAFLGAAKSRHLQLLIDWMNVDNTAQANYLVLPKLSYKI
ncbi:hypothetical protein FACS1894103_0680 [Campylobacterota bacterium]|nr:hypothetical protein FACS1894103_0430 [Campylobacterota bacterium]GHV58717.1 hypothetical protein FACS1894103_0680 [Campylobacterota bacterium]